MPTNRVRVTLDLDIEPGKGKPQDIVDVVFEARKKIGDYITAVVIPNNDLTESARVKVVGGNSHEHSDDPNDYGYCDYCDNLSRKPQTSRVGP